MRRNPDNNPHREIEANDQRTFKVVETYQGKCAVLATWEKEPDEVQANNHDYIIRLRATVRKFKNYLVHRADARIKI